MNNTIHAKLRKFLLCLHCLILAYGYNVTNAQVNNPTNSDILIAFESDENSGLFLIIRNSSDKELKLVSDIENVLTDEFLKFPLNGTFQFKNAREDILHIRGENDQGWISHVMGASNLKMAARAIDQAPGKMQELILAPNKTRRFGLQYSGAIKLIKTLSPESAASGTQFRIKITINVSKSGKIIKQEILSDWLGYPIC